MYLYTHTNITYSTETLTIRYHLNHVNAVHKAGCEMHIYNIERESFNRLKVRLVSLHVYVCVSQAHSMQHSYFPVKTEWTRSYLPLLVCEMSFSTHRNGRKEGSYQNLLNILQVYIPVPHSKKSPMVWKCMCMSEREIQVWQLPHWVSQDFTS